MMCEQPCRMIPEEYPKAFFYKRIVQTKLFIDDHFADKIDVDNIADEACFSKFHFIREFKKIYGKSPHQYLVFVRLEWARQLLQKIVCVAYGLFKRKKPCVR